MPKQFGTTTHGVYQSYGNSLYTYSFISSSFWLYKLYIFLNHAYFEISLFEVLFIMSLSCHRDITMKSFLVNLLKSNSTRMGGYLGQQLERNCLKGLVFARFLFPKEITVAFTFVLHHLGYFTLFFLSICFYIFIF